MGLDSWTRHPYERYMRERADNAPGRKPLDERLKDKFRDFRDGTSRCGCGCGKTGTMFRGGVRYAPGCVGKKWEQAGLPVDRTPPKRRWG